jgi:exodeoxyribonuclease-3
VSFAVGTWNVNSLRVRLPHLQQWTEQNPHVDVVCLQETKLEDDKFPADALREAGWIHQAFAGQKTYNGVAMLSKHPITDPALGFVATEPDEQPRLVRGTVQGVRIFGCYVPNGQRVGSPKFRYKLAWLRKLRAELDAEGDPGRELLVCGDFNIAPAEQDCWDPWEAENEILFHPLEHKALAHVTEFGLIDSLRQVKPTGQAFTWWDYRASGFRRNQGFRIDHVYVTPSLAARLTEVQTHRDTRGWDQPSDHAPVVAVFS